MILLVICQVVVICPTVGHLLLSVVIGQLRTPAQVVSSVIGDCSNLVVLTCETELFCFTTILFFCVYFEQYSLRKLKYFAHNVLFLNFNTQNICRNIYFEY